MGISEASFIKENTRSLVTNLIMAISEKRPDEPNITARLIELIMKLSEDEQRRLLNELERTHFLKKRKHHRKPYFSVVDYASQGEGPTRISFRT